MHYTAGYAYRYNHRYSGYSESYSYHWGGSEQHGNTVMLMAMVAAWTVFVAMFTVILLAVVMVVAT